MLSLLFEQLSGYIPFFTSHMHNTILIFLSIILSLLMRPNLIIELVGLELKHRLRLITSL